MESNILANKLIFHDTISTRYKVLVSLVIDVQNKYTSKFRVVFFMKQKAESKGDLSNNMTAFKEHNFNENCKEYCVS